MTRKILHVVGAMNRAGVETWLMHVLRAIDGSRFEFHFLVHTTEVGAYDEEIRRLGGQIHQCPAVRNPLRYAREFKAILREHGPFDAVHSHVYLYSGFVMRLAAEGGVPIRIAQSHTAPTAPQNVTRFVYEQLMRHWIHRFSTHRIGASRAAAEALFGKPGAQTATVLYGFDFSRFFEQRDRQAVRVRLGIPLGRKVIGHVGRFTPVKNHGFIVEMFDNVIRSGIDAHLVLAGEGPLFPSIRRDIETRGLSDRCTFAGVESDIAPLVDAMDVFVFPSLYEGLGIVAAEAQAAGVPVIASRTVPEEVNIIPRLIERISLQDGPAAWASAVIRTLSRGTRKRGDEALLVQNSAFSLAMCIEKLGRIYEGRDAEMPAAAARDRSSSESAIAQSTVGAKSALGAESHLGS